MSLLVLVVKKALTNQGRVNNGARRMRETKGEVTTGRDGRESWRRAARIEIFYH